MPMIQTDSKHYTDIANAIRAKNGLLAQYYPEDMARAINDLPVFGTLAMPIYLGSQMLYYGTLNTNSTSRTNFYAMSASGSPSDVSTIEFTNFIVPDGYEKYYRVSAILNSFSSNLSEIYINDIKMISSNTWVGDGNIWIEHYGKQIFSDLFRFKDIPTEPRYMYPTSGSGYNFNLRSSASGQKVWAEKVTLHIYLVKNQS